ncbi:MAG: DUF4959 domain-containing protein, partial [Sphingobacteriales bacterium]
MKQINYKMLLICLCISALGLSACKKNNGYNTEPISNDKTKPDVVSNIKVDNFNGGAYITYDLPNSDNILYVLAKYDIRDNVSLETKSSYYSDTIKVEGFAKAQEYEVTLYTVTRANVISDPVTVKVNPETPVYQLVRPSVEISADFGGVNVKTFNPLKKEIGVILIAYDDVTQDMEVQDQHFTRLDTVDYSIRGYETDERDFGVYITDQWGNVSDTVKVKLSPLYEELLDKSKFSQYSLASDAPPYDGNWIVSRLWDGNTGEPGWHTGSSGKAPFIATFNVGSTYKLSRFIMWQRPDSWAYGHGNPRDFSLWGSNVASPRDAQLPLTAAPGTVIGDWTNLGNYNFPPPPSGMPVPGNSADNEFIKAGVNFNVPFNAPSVKF